MPVIALNNTIKEVMVFKDCCINKTIRVEREPKTLKKCPPDRCPALLHHW